MESQEQNLKSESIIQDKIIIEPMSTPYRAFFSMKRSFFNSYINNYWEKNKENLVNFYGYKGKKDKGGVISDYKKARESLEKTLGVSTLYRYAISDVIKDSINKKLGKEKELLMVSSVNIKNYKEENQDPIIFVVFFCWPKVYGLKKEDISFNIKKPELNSIEDEYKGRLRDLQVRHSEKQIIEDPTELPENCEVMLDITSFYKGKKYEEGSFLGKWAVYDEITVEKLKDCIKNHLDGSTFNVSYPSVRDPSMMLDIKGRVRSVRIDKLPEINKALFDKEGFKDEAQFREFFEKEFDKYIKQLEENAIFDSIIDQIILNGKLEAIPEVWLDMNTEYMVNMHIEKYGGNVGKALEVVGLTDKSQLSAFFSDQVFKNTLNQMALRYYIDLFDLPVDIVKVLNHMRNNVIWS